MQSFFARSFRRSSVRRREVFTSQFDGGRTTPTSVLSIRLGCDVLEQRIVLASPESDFIFSKGVIKGYKGAGGVVEIPATINGKSVVSIGARAFSVKNNTATDPITSVVIPDSVKTIGNHAFAVEVAEFDSYPISLTSLASVTIGNGVTSIGGFAFANASSLTSLTIGNQVKRIGSSAFQGASSLTSVTIPDSVTTVGSYAFAYAEGLTNLTIGRGLKTIADGVFAGASSLESLTIPDGVKSIGYYAFASPSRLASLTIPGSVSTIGNDAFFEASNLTVLTIGSGVKTIGAEAFGSATSLTSLTIPSSVKSIKKNAFNGALRLGAVTFTGKAPSIGVNAFADVAIGAKAYRAQGMAGYGPDGSNFHGLIVATPT